MILDIIKKFGRAVSIDEILENVNMDSQELQKEINSYISTFDLIRLKDGKVVLPRQIGVCVGKIQCHPKGFAFLLQEDEDVFIPADDVANALNGDVVLVRLYTGKRRGHSKEGRVIDVIQRNIEQIVGTVARKNGKYILISDDQKILKDIIIDNLNGAKVDEVVLTKILKYPIKNKPIVVNVVKVIGDKNDNTIDIDCAIAQFDIPTEFKKSTIKEAREIQQKIGSIEGRYDFRNDLTISIDSEDAKDLDDAVCVSFDGEIYTLKVHIADVSHYVKEGSSLDADAYLRGNSVYFPGRVIPMLPKELSNGICSLNEGVDRYALSCIMKINQSGKVIDYQVVKSVINSKHRMTYYNVNRILAGDKDVKSIYSDIVPMIENMNNLKQILFNSRLRMGSLEFDIPEAKFILDKDGKIKDVKRREHGNSEQMIEEFMLIANRTVCKYMINMDMPCVYRVHEQPSEDKMDAFAAFINSYGFTFNKSKVTPKKMQKLLNDVKNSPIENAVSVIMLRTLQKARYSSVNYHHFGLAFDDYCHFTSPIRRYSDLIVHRILTGHLQNKPVKQKNLENICNHISETEKIAMEAEMKVNDIYKCHYLSQFIGEEFEGTISGMNSSGFYVMLENTCEGMVRFCDIKGDYFTFNEKLFHAMGERTRKMFKIGDFVKVKLVKVDTKLVQVDMILIS